MSARDNRIRVAVLPGDGIGPEVIAGGARTADIVAKGQVPVSTRAMGQAVRTALEQRLRA